MDVDSEGTYFVSRATFEGREGDGPGDHITERVAKLTAINQALQIVAIVLGGGWAILTFYTGTFERWGPNFGGRLTLVSEWSPDFEICLFDVELALTNESARAHEIESVEYFGTWHPVSEMPQVGEFALVDPDPEMGAQHSLSRHRSGESPLVKRYAPREGSVDGFQIFSEPTPGEVLFVRAVATLDTGVSWNWYEWTQACRQPDKAQATR